MPSDYLVLQLFNTLTRKGSWSLLRYLESGHKRYKDIVPTILPKAQANKILRELQDEKLITKAIHGYKSYQYTAYELTKDGKKLLEFFTETFQPHDLIIDAGQPREDEK